MAPTSASPTKESADSEQLFSMLFLFAGPVIAFIAAVVLGW